MKHDIRLLVVAIVLAFLLLFVIVSNVESQSVYNATCDEGFVQLNKTFDDYDIFHHTLYPDRKHPLADGYIALDWYDRGLMGEWFYFRWLDEDRWHIVRVADVRQKKHQAKHDEIWGDTWLAEIDERLWGDRPWRARRAVMCRLYGFPPQPAGVLRRMAVPFTTHTNAEQ